MATGPAVDSATRRLLRELRDALEDVQFVAQVLRHRAEDVRQKRAMPLVEDHWWARVRELPDIARRVLERIERVVARRRRRRQARVSAWRERVLQLAFPGASEWR